MIQPLDLEVLKTTDPKPVPWVVHGMVARGALTVLFSPGGLGKSIFCMAISKAISEGEEVAGIRCAKAAVLSLDAENGQDEIHRRVVALGFDKDYYPNIVSDFSIEINLASLEAVYDDCFPNLPSVLILDSLRTLWPEGDENDSGSVTRMLSALQGFARKYDLAVVLIHHSSKAGGFRGSGAIQNVPDIVVELGRKLKDKDETRRYLRWEKCRLGPQPKQRWFAIQSDNLGMVQIMSSHAPIWNSDPEKSELWPD